MQKRTKILLPIALAVMVVAGTFATLTLADTAQTTSPTLQVGDLFLIQSTRGSVIIPDVDFTSQNGTHIGNSTVTTINQTQPQVDSSSLGLSFGLLLNITNVNPANATFRILTGQMTIGPFGVSSIHGRGMIVKLSNETRIRLAAEGYNARLGAVRFFFIGLFIMTPRGLMLRFIGLLDMHRSDALLTARAAFLRTQSVTQPLFA